MDGVPLFPVVSYEVSRHLAAPAIFLKLDFLSHSMQDPAAPTPGRMYALTPAEARKLARRILEECDRADASPPHSPPGPQH